MWLRAVECCECERAQRHALQLGHRIAAEARYPDVRTIKDDAKGSSAHGKGAEQGASAWQELRHILTDIICHPDVAPSKRHREWLSAYRNSAEVSSVQS